MACTSRGTLASTTSALLTAPGSWTISPRRRVPAHPWPRHPFHAQHGLHEVLRILDLGLILAGSPSFLGTGTRRMAYPSYIASMFGACVLIAAPAIQRCTRSFYVVRARSKGASSAGSPRSWSRSGTEFELSGSFPHSFGCSWRDTSARMLS